MKRSPAELRCLGLRDAVIVSVINCIKQASSMAGNESLEVEVCISAECDEQWSFVSAKSNQRWLWHILEKSTRKVPAFVFGKRDNVTFKRLIELLPAQLIDRLDTDDWKSYNRNRLLRYILSAKI